MKDHKLFNPPIKISHSFRSEFISVCFTLYSFIPRHKSDRTMNPRRRRGECGRDSRKEEETMHMFTKEAA